MKNILIDILLVLLIIFVGVALGWCFVNGGYKFILGLIIGLFMGITMMCCLQVIREDS